MLDIGLRDGIGIFFTYLPIICIFTLDKPYQSDLLKSVSKWLSIALGLSLFVFALTKVMSLPHTTFIVPNNDFYQSFDNYFFYIYTAGYESDTAGVARFGAFFLEPGHLSMICFLMLFANRFRFKDQPYLWIPLACILISFSLTGYVLLTIGFIVLKIKNIFYMLTLSIIIGGSWLFVTEMWDGGENPVNILIVQRLEPDKEKGIKGNNRTYKKTDIFFRQCVKDGRIWTGVGTKKNWGDRIKGAGYKIYCLKYGLIGVIIVALLYLCLINPKSNKRYAYSFFIMIILLFLQRAYPDWYSWLFFYTTGIGVMRHEPFFSKSGQRKIKGKQMQSPELAGQ